MSETELRKALAGPARDWQERHRQGSFVTTPDEFVNAILALPEMAALVAEQERVRRAREALDALSRETGAYEASYKGWAQQVIRRVRDALGEDA